MASEPYEHERPDWGDEAGGADAAEASLPGEQRSFFTFGRCCGCLAIIGVFLLIGGIIAVNMGLNAVLPRAPIEVPRVEYSEERGNDVESRARSGLVSGEVVTLTPEELTILLDRELRKETAEGRFHCAATADGLLDIRMSFRLPDGWLGGRYLNLTVVGDLRIEDEEVTYAKLESLVLGNFFDLSELDEANSRKWVEEIREGSRVDSQASTNFGRVKLFRFDGTRIEIQLDPE